jgi:hypothetical protein
MKAYYRCLLQQDYHVICCESAMPPPCVYRIQKAQFCLPHPVHPMPMKCLGIVAVAVAVAVAIHARTEISLLEVKVAKSFKKRVRDVRKSRTK